MSEQTLRTQLTARAKAAPALLEVKNLKKYFPIRARLVPARSSAT